MVLVVALCALGLLAIAAPFFTTLAIDILIGWLFMVGGIVRALALIKGAIAEPRVNYL